MTTRTFSTITELPTHDGGPVFSARGPRGMVDLDPFLNVDLFHMTGPVFAPHPHAGFSAVTYMFDDSTTRFRNRDSLGDDSTIEPGGLHWTVAGSGIVHEEVVDEVGLLGHGAQIFVRLPADAELDAPYGMHFTPDELPNLALDDSARLRVVAGDIDGDRSPVHEATGAHVYDLVIEPDARVVLPVDPDFRGFLMTIHGDARIATGTQHGALGPTGIAVFEPGDGAVEITAGAAGAQLLVGAGRPLRSPAFMHGGFCLSTRDRVVDAVERYSRGDMHGALAV